MGWHPQPEIQTHQTQELQPPSPPGPSKPKESGLLQRRDRQPKNNKEAVPRDPRTLRSPPSTPGGLIAPGTTTSQAPHDTSPNPVYNKRSGLHGNGEVNSRLGYGTKSSTQPRKISRPQAKVTPHPPCTHATGQEHQATHQDPWNKI